MDARGAPPIASAAANGRSCWKNCTLPWSTRAGTSRSWRILSPRRRMQRSSASSSPTSGAGKGLDPDGRERRQGAACPGMPPPSRRVGSSRREPCGTNGSVPAHSKNSRMASTAGIKPTYSWSGGPARRSRRWTPRWESLLVPHTPKTSRRKLMRVAIYVRVSTPNQVSTQTIDQQLERLQAFITTQAWELPVDSIFRDDGYSGASLKRPGLDRLRDGAALARFDKILVTDPDRLARNYVHQVLLLEELQQHGCQVEFLDRPMSQDPHDQLLLQIRGAVAEYERTLIAERMRRGRIAKFRAGLLLPWSHPPYGYRHDPDRPRDPAGVRL